MKIKSGFILRQSGKQFEAVNEIKGEIVITDINETGKFLWEKLQDNVTENALVSAMLVNYDIDGATAENEVYDFLVTLKEADVI